MIKQLPKYVIRLRFMRETNHARSCQNPLTNFWPMFPLYTPSKRQERKGFLMFSGDIKVDIGRKWFKLIRIFVKKLNHRCLEVSPCTAAVQRKFTNPICTAVFSAALCGAFGYGNLNVSDISKYFN